MKIVILIGACLLIFPAEGVFGQNYVRDLVSNLLAIGYPVTREDVIALDKIAMRFDTRNRLDVLKKILADREEIHNIPDAGYFAKTEAVRSALRLLDEHDLPEANALIMKLNQQGGWTKREKELLAYMAAKRNMDYPENVGFLLASAARYSDNSDLMSRVEITVAILDFCNVLSYLADIFNHTGDVRILNVLFDHASRAYGYPAEYASRLLVDMCRQQPDVFISVLSGLKNEMRKTIIDAVVFGIWNAQQKIDVEEVLSTELDLTGDREMETVVLLIDKINRKFPDTPGTDEEMSLERQLQK